MNENLRPYVIEDLRDPAKPVEALVESHSQSAAIGVYVRNTISAKPASAMDVIRIGKLEVMRRTPPPPPAAQQQLPGTEPVAPTSATTGSVSATAAVSGVAIKPEAPKSPEVAKAANPDIAKAATAIKSNGKVAAKA